MDVLELAKKRLKYSENGKLYWIDVGVRADLNGKEAGSVSSSDGYRYIKINQKRIPAHRVVFYMHHGYLPDEVDHINRNRDDNRIENLRAAKRIENSRNVSTQKRKKTSVFKGVVYDKNRCKWMASTKNKGKTVYLGRFETELEAAKAYNKYAISNFGQFAAINDISIDGDQVKTK